MSETRYGSFFDFDFDVAFFFFFVGRIDVIVVSVRSSRRTSDGLLICLHLLSLSLSLSLFFSFSFSLSLSLSLSPFLSRCLSLMNSNHILYESNYRAATCWSPSSFSFCSDFFFFFFCSFCLVVSRTVEGRTKKGTGTKNDFFFLIFPCQRSLFKWSQTYRTINNLELKEKRKHFRQHSKHVINKKNSVIKKYIHLSIYQYTETAFGKYVLNLDSPPDRINTRHNIFISFYWNPVKPGKPHFESRQEPTDGRTKRCAAKQNIEEQHINRGTSFLLSLLLLFFTYLTKQLKLGSERWLFFSTKTNRLSPRGR